MSTRSFAAFAAALSMYALASPALACRGDRECYDKMRLPDVYRAADRPVLVRSGYREVIETEPVVVVRPERVLIEPRRIGYEMTPPVTRTVFQEIVVRRAGYRWETTYGPYGERRCKVPVPAEIKVVPREVLVEPGRRVRVDLPAVYGLRERVVAVRPARRILMDVPPVIARERARHLVRRGGTAWVRADARW
jgi:hypothetical protein